ncbi:hypothetical protein CEUSTIGMA_g12310.t1 [Chlamydomonas eustigma]|uniref:C2H2-type domain-containing protein n=1 Tax=Chlamydomonas eustigma TaxID=1157962 RepID=A0A250XPL4_9CHLO|nr:hypothetical protein CEUSTIGMA_g12310.t1 [Chlamydomonas eustigma]|eukprot:GAX84889.1 hypothetical protein CEUSTIGMA_g12310.t1 [Chlamydomonas eustigma]
MGKKKKKNENKPWCYYCDRVFDDEAMLVQHQRHRHFKCPDCPKKLNTAQGLSTHAYQVHKTTINSVPNCKPGRESMEIEIFGMAGVPDGLRPGDIPDDDEPASKQQKTDAGGMAGAVGGMMQPSTIMTQQPGYPGSMPGAYGSLPSSGVMGMPPPYMPGPGPYVGPSMSGMPPPHMGLQPPYGGPPPPTGVGAPSPYMAPPMGYPMRQGMPPPSSGMMGMPPPAIGGSGGPPAAPLFPIAPGGGGGAPQQQPLSGLGAQLFPIGQNSSSGPAGPGGYGSGTGVQQAVGAAATGGTDRGGQAGEAAGSTAAGSVEVVWNDELFSIEEVRARHHKYSPAAAARASTRPAGSSAMGPPGSLGQPSGPPGVGGPTYMGMHPQGHQYMGMQPMQRPPVGMQPVPMGYPPGQYPPHSMPMHYNGPQYS